MFSADTYQKRRDILKKNMGSGLLLFLGNNESPINFQDNSYRFRQDSSFLYFFGISQPGLTALIDVENDREIIFGDELSIDMIVWMGNQPTIANLAAKAGIKEVRSTNELTKYMQQALSRKVAIHFLPPYRPDNMWLLHRLFGYHQDEMKKLASLDLVKAVIRQREIKMPEELVEIERAVDISVDMHVAAIKSAKPGMMEAEIAGIMHEVALAAGGDIAFPIIATINGQTLHNHYHGNRIKDGDLFLCDAGAETAMGYAGDISSTFPVSKTFSSRQKEIYEITLSAHEAALNELKPGIPFKEVHFTSAKKIVEGLKHMGMMKGDTGLAVENGAHALFFPCGTGHMMGLDVHDMEDLGEEYVGYDGQPKSTQFGLKSLRLGKALKPGHVVTIEPGIYFIPELIDLWRKEGINKDFLNFEKINQYRDFGGIRNEEDVVITDNGYRILGKPCPKSINEIEGLR